MPRDFSENFKVNIVSTRCAEEMVCLFELENENLIDSNGDQIIIYLAVGDADIESNGNLYLGCYFETEFPQEAGGEMQRAMMRFNNIGKHMSRWIDQSLGGRGTRVRMKLIMKNEPDVIEYEWCGLLTNVFMTMTVIEGEVTFDNMMNRAAVAIVYSRKYQRGIY